MHENCTRLKINKATQQSYHKEKEELSHTPGDVWLQPPVTGGRWARTAGDRVGPGGSERPPEFLAVRRRFCGPRSRPSRLRVSRDVWCVQLAVAQAHLPPLTGAVLAGDAASLMAVVGRPPLPRLLPPSSTSTGHEVTQAPG